MKFISVGFSNSVNSDKIVAVVSPDSLPTKRMIADAREDKRLIDVSSGRKTRCVIVLENGYVMLCGLQGETIISRMNSGYDLKDKNNFVSCENNCMDD